MDAAFVVHSGSGGVAAARGWRAVSARARANVRMCAAASPSAISRREAMQALAASALAVAASGVGVRAANAAADDGFNTSSSGLKYKLVKKGSGQVKPVAGDLIGVRFRGSYNGRVFDDLFKTDEALYIRVGNGSVLKGVEEALTMMYRGDVYDLVIPPTLAFGNQGRRASAGKPALPPNATLEYEIELAEFPGKEAELIELQ